MVVRPDTARSDPGVVVPTPTFPVLSTTSAVPEALRNAEPNLFDDVATANTGSVDDAEDEVAWTDNSAHGVDEPIATLPCESMRKAVVVELVVDERLAVTRKRLVLESDDVALTDNLANGEVEDIPREAGVAFQKKFALSCVRRPLAPMNGTEPAVRKEKVADDVDVSVPMVSLPTVVDEKVPETMKPMFEKRAVEVALVATRLVKDADVVVALVATRLVMNAVVVVEFVVVEFVAEKFVAKRLTKVEVAVEVAVIEPTVRKPMDDDAMYSLTA